MTDWWLALATTLQLWVGADTRQHLDVWVTTPPTAVALVVIVANDDTERRSERRLESGAPRQRFVFSNLAEGLYTVQASTVDDRGQIRTVTRDVVVTR